MTAVVLYIYYRDPVLFRKALRRSGAQWVPYLLHLKCLWEKRRKREEGRRKERERKSEEKKEIPSNPTDPGP